jgi:predicted TIM-barrel fold metal-dependent hydrolase
MKSVIDRTSAIGSPRRHFVKKGLALVAGLAIGKRPLLQAAASPEPSADAFGRPQRTQREPVAVFDSHLHCPGDDGDAGQWYPITKTFDEFVAYLDRTGVQRGVVNSTRSEDAKTPADFIAGNREVARHIEKYKGRFLGACVVNPTFPEEAAREIEHCRKQLGFVWVGELCNYIVNPYAYTSKNFAQVVEQVVKMNMVLHVHTELEEMEYIIQTFPQATIVFAHFGDSHEEEHIFKRIDAVARSKNCYLDTSGYGHDRVGVLEYAVKSIGPDRVLFGSDFTVNDPSTVLARIHHAFLTEEQKQKILSQNLEALLEKVGA